MSGSVAIADVELDVSGDTNYAVYFTKDDFGIQDKIALLNISDGATVENHYSVGVDNDVRIKFSDGSHTIFTKIRREAPASRGGKAQKYYRGNGSREHSAKAPDIQCCKETCRAVVNQPNAADFSPAASPSL